MPKEPLSDEEIDGLLKRIRSGLKVTKVVASRSVKTRNGDSFVGFSVAFDSKQDDSGQGVDFMLVDEPEGMSLRDASLASLVLGLHVDLAAHRNALAGGAITQAFYEGQMQAIKQNYAMLIQQTLQEVDSDE